MNEARRLEITKAISLIEEAKSILETTSTDERESADELSESLRDSDSSDSSRRKKAEAAETAASILEESLDHCDDLIDKLNDAKV